MKKLVEKILRAIPVLRSNRKTGPHSRKMKRLAGRLKPGDIAIDCGANVGEVTALMAAGGAAVYAFEPNPFAFALLKKRFDGAPNVTCFNKGVWVRDETLKMYLHVRSEEDEIKWSTGSSILPFKGNVSPDRCLRIEVIDLAGFIRSLGRKVALLKIDIEGAECEVLERLIEEKLYSEVNLTLVETHEKKIPLLREKTNRIRRMLSDSRIRNIKLNWL
ncbi:MAG: FkbM family methyltransferase [Planctomycetota bacterium]